MHRVCENEFQIMFNYTFMIFNMSRTILHSKMACFEKLPRTAPDTMFGAIVELTPSPGLPRSSPGHRHPRNIVKYIVRLEFN